MYDTIDESRRIVYGESGATFVPKCEKCLRYVKADKSIWINGAGDIKPNATCSKCGRTSMLFEGYI